MLAIGFEHSNSRVHGDVRPIVLKPGPRGWPGTRPTWGWNRAGSKKKQGKEKPGVTQQDPVVNPLAFFFLLKQRCFDLKNKKNWPGPPGDPVKTQNPGLGPGRVLKLWLDLQTTKLRVDIVELHAEMVELCWMLMEMRSHMSGPYAPPYWPHNPDNDLPPTPLPTPSLF